MLELTREAARALLIAAQGLGQPPAAPATKADLLGCIQRMGLLQIDTIHVIARSPYLVLYSRVGAFEQRWLEELLAAGQIFEYWAHEACFIPQNRYPHYRRTILDGLGRRHWTWRQEWLAENSALVAQIVGRIRSEGPVRSADFERTDGQKSGWWNWKAEKQALEALFTLGELMVARRERFQRIYDLRERVVPGWDDAAAPSLDAVQQTFAADAVRALGVARPRDVADYYRTKQAPTLAALRALRAAGALLPVRVAGWPEEALLHPDNLALAERAAAGALAPTTTHLLSPFDPIVWDRRRALDLFGFDYRIECYTPAPKRRYGYFTLPILWRDQIVGRLDPKAHRASGVFEVKTLHLEPHCPPTPQLAADLAAALRDLAAWHGTPEVRIGQSDPPEFAGMVRV